MTSPSPPAYSVDVRGLNKSFGAKHVVNDVSLAVARGEIFGFLGPNGSGKTTTIRLMCGLLTPDSGEGTCLGYDIRRQQAEIKKRVGYMTQRFSFWEDLSIRENLDFIGRIYRMPRRREAVERAIESLGLAGRATQLAGTLSGGWKQRLALAASLMHEPSVLFLDEPTAGIDPVARRELWNLLFTLAARGVTLLVSTHYMDEAERCSHVGYLYLSKMLVEGEPKDLTRLPEVTPAGTRRVEAECEAGVAAVMQHARELPYVEDLTIFGNSLHLLVRDDVADERMARDLEASAGAAVTVRPIDASLEDVFVRLTEIERAKRTEGALR